MPSDSEFIQSLIDQPRESLAVEIKDWIDPQQDAGIAKIAKACMALRNLGGGYLIIGLLDDGQPNPSNAPTSLESTFHTDVVASIVGRFASEPFEVHVHFAERDGVRYPVLEIPSGVKSPVAAKANLPDSTGRSLVQMNRVYVRSLNANNVPSTTEATWRDWPTIVEKCLDNREADVGRFVRRHLSALTPNTVRMLSSLLNSPVPPNSVPGQLATEFLEIGHRRFVEFMQSRSIEIPQVGMWEFAAVVEGNVPPHSSNQTFLQLVFSTNPRYTGWPVLIDSRSLVGGSQPQVLDDGWQSLILIAGSRPSLDFWRIEPAGRFYLIRGFQDDLTPGGPPPGSVLDFSLVILRTAEAIAVVLAVVRAMGCRPEDTSVAFAFRWSKLANRRLASWANPSRALHRTRQAVQDTVATTVRVPLDAPDSAVGEYVRQATSPVFNIFEGVEFDPRISDELTRELLERRL